jgi:hypothetical protein
LRVAGRLAAPRARGRAAGARAERALKFFYTPFFPPTKFTFYTPKKHAIKLTFTPRARSARRFYCFLHPFLGKNGDYSPHFLVVFKSFSMYLN